MNSKVLFILLLIIAGVAVFGLTAKPKTEASLAVSASTQEGEQSDKLATVSKTMGVVSVDITPTSMEAGKEIVFDVVMNNHSVDLGYDYTQIAALTDDRGNTYKPTQWTGNSGGHHVRGQLIFSVLSDKPQQLTLTLNGVDNETADFSWEL